MSACLQRFEWRSQRANLPSLGEPGRHDRKGMGGTGRFCRPPGQRRQARRTAWPARPAARARPLAGVVPAGRAARPASRPPCPASTSWSRSPGRTSLPGPGQLCRRHRPSAGTPARCQDWPNPVSPASAARASSAFPACPRPGPGGMRRRPAAPSISPRRRRRQPSASWQWSRSRPSARQHPRSRDNLGPGHRGRRVGGRDVHRRTAWRALRARAVRRRHPA
jgi:hypothetical protein